MTFADPWPWWVLVPALAVAVLLAWRAYAPRAAALSSRRRRVLVAFRLLTLVLLIVFLMRPVMVLPARAPREAIVPVLVDMSRSMQIADVDGHSRIEAARTLLDQALRPALAQEFTLRLHGFSEGVTRLEPSGMDAAGRESDLVGAVQAVQEQYRGRELAGIVVVTDGGDTGTGELTGQGLASGVPLFAVGVGASRIARDREVLDVTAGRAVVRDSVVGLSASIVSHGYGATAFDVRLLENGRPIQVQRVEPSADDSPVRALFQVSPAADAATLYTVEIPTAEGELVEPNNRRSVLVQPPERPRRILVLQGAPGYDHAFMMRAFAADAGLEADAVVRKGQDDRGENTYFVQAPAERATALGAGFPDSRRALFAYDAVVLANVPADLLGREQLALIERFVAHRGGGLLVLGAESFGRPGFVRTPVEAVLPLALDERWEGPLPADAASVEPNRVLVTTEGARFPVMRIGDSDESTRTRWASLPPLGGSTALGGPRPGASVLALTVGPGGSVRPLIAVQRYGRGRSFLFAGEASWRWRMLLPREDTSYERFWQQAARWLTAAAPPPVLVSMKGGAAPGSTVAVELIVRDDEYEPASDAAVSVTLNGPGVDRVERTAELLDPEAGRYGLEFRPDQAGVYSVTPDVRRAGVAVEAPDVWMLVGGAGREFTDPRRDDEFLRRLTAETGGEFLTAGDVDRLSGLLRSGMRGTGPPAYRDLWHGLWTFALLLGLLCAEWVVRRQAGLR